MTTSQVTNALAECEKTLKAHLPGFTLRSTILFTNSADYPVTIDISLSRPCPVESAAMASLIERVQQQAAHSAGGQHS